MGGKGRDVVLACSDSISNLQAGLSSWQMAESSAYPRLAQDFLGDGKVNWQSCSLLTIRNVCRC
jgi:hypothetical protein